MNEGGEFDMKVKVIITDASVGNKCGQGCQAEGSCRC